MQLKGIVLDPVNHMPVVLLKQEDEDVILPIWIGIFEANAIALKLDDVETPRPMTHDLLNNVFNSLGTTIERIVISNLEDNTFYAEIIVKRGDEELIIDSRPSDAIALAVRTDAPIFADPEVLENAQSIKLDEKSSQEQLKKWLDSLDPKDFGKYRM